MSTENKVIYRLDDNISFRKCTLYDGGELFHGDCTNFSEREEIGTHIIFATNMASTFIVQSTLK